MSHYPSRTATTDDDEFMGIGCGILAGPVAAAAVLSTIGAVAVMLAPMLISLAKLLVSFAQALAQVGSFAGNFLLSFGAPWTLVASQILIGVLLGFGLGLRAQKPGVTR